MNIFKQMYTVRRYKGTSWDSGTAETTYSDMQLPLDVQAKTRRNQDDASGRSTTGVLTVYSDVQLLPTEPDKQTTGDRLLYMGQWYACKSSIYWGNTILKHWISEFEAVEGEKGEIANDTSCVPRGGSAHVCGTVPSLHSDLQLSQFRSSTASVCRSRL